MSGAAERGLAGVLEAMEACLANNSPTARSRAQFENTMFSLIGQAWEAARRDVLEAFQAGRDAPLSPTEQILGHLLRQGTGSVRL